MILNDIPTWPNSFFVLELIFLLAEFKNFYSENGPATQKWQKKKLFHFKVSRLIKVAGVELENDVEKVSFR